MRSVLSSTARVYDSSILALKKEVAPKDNRRNRESAQSRSCSRRAR